MVPRIDMSSNLYYDMLQYLSLELINAGVVEIDDCFCKWGSILCLAASLFLKLVA